MSSRAAIALPG